MSRTARWTIGILIAVTIAQGVALYLGRRALWQANLAAANERAAHDRTRVRLADQVFVAERLAQQRQVQLEAAQRRADRIGQVRVGVEVARKQLADTQVAVVTIDTNKVPVAEIEAKLDARDSLGVFVKMHTDLFGVVAAGPAAPQAWTRFEVTREPLLLDVSLSCERQEHGTDAVVQVSGPRWASIDITEPQVQPEVCNPKPPAWRPFSLKAPSLPVAAALIGLGYLLAK